MLRGSIAGAFCAGNSGKYNGLSKPDFAFQCTNEKYKTRDKIAHFVPLQGMTKRNSALLFLLFLGFGKWPEPFCRPSGSGPVSCRVTSSAHFATPDDSKADSIIGFASKFLGLPYIYGSVNPDKGFDCSGFVWYVFGQYGINVPRSSIDYERLGKEVCIDSCRKGDIIVFTGTNASIRHAGHVGIVVSKPGEDPRFIHSSSSKKHNGVVLSAFSDSPYYGKRFIKVVRVMP